MNELGQIFPYIAQLPIVALVLWLNRQHKKDQDDQRSRFITYIEKRDARFLEVLSEHSATNRQISSEIRTLAQCVTRLDARLKG